MAVGARSGHDEPEDRPGSPAHSQPAGAAEDGTTVSGTESDGGASGGSTARKKNPRPFWKELPLLIGVALVLALLIKTFLVQ
ncbi:signal peptidase I, partial [Streptomyces sp. NPDC019224]